MATHSSVPAWRLPGMGEPGGLPSVGSHRVRHDWSSLATAAAAAGHSCSLPTFFEGERKNSERTHINISLKQPTTAALILAFLQGREIALTTISLGFPGGPLAKNPPANAGESRDSGSIPRSGRSLGVRNGNPLQYSCLENSRNRGACCATVHEVTKIQTQLSTHAPYLHQQWLL